jgi:hypothetical protein
MKIDCDHAAFSGLGQVAGPVEGVQLVEGPVPPNDIAGPSLIRPAEIIFPLRPGASHVFQFEGYTFSPAAGRQLPGGAEIVVADQWMAGEKPIVTMYRHH